MPEPQPQEVAHHTWEPRRWRELQERSPTSIALGGAQRCLDEAVAYTKDRKQFDTPIADFQNTPADRKSVPGRLAANFGTRFVPKLYMLEFILPI